jgi:glycosyltransferase involved in cell wall biosynthesis
VRVSVVIPTWNEEAWLPRLLAVLNAASFHEVIVADNASTDATKRVATDWGCKIVEGGRPGAARNRGAAVATGDALLFVDADVVPARSTLAVIRTDEASAATDLVTFRHVPITDARFVCLCYRIADLWFLALSKLRIRHGLASFVLVTREVFDSVGGFSETIEPVGAENSSGHPDLHLCHGRRQLELALGNCAIYPNRRRSHARFRASDIV